MSKNILVLCADNGCRSQIAQAFLQYFDKNLKVCSAGTNSSGILDQEAVKIMKEINIDISNNSSEPVEKYIDEDWDYVITVCRDADENYPLFKGVVKNRRHIGFADPSKATGTPIEIEREYRRIRDQIKTKLYQFYSDELSDDSSCSCGANYFCRCQ